MNNHAALYFNAWLGAGQIDTVNKEDHTDHTSRRAININLDCNHQQRKEGYNNGIENGCVHQLSFYYKD